ncbi:MAG TPA: protein kinase, partial [Chloroflexota bacterium]|nr:protein kinase [Chloroflexota bacterium]
LAHPLRDVPLFRDVPVADLVAIWRCLSEERLPAGSVVCQRGEPGDRFYIVQSGQVEVRLGLGPDGITIRHLRPGDWFGELALLTGEPRSADCVAVEDLVLWELKKSDFDQLTTHSVPLMRALNQALCSLVSKMTVQLEEARHGGTPGISGMRFGPYRVVEQLGAGGMAAVYSCVHIETETAAAVKVLPMVWGKAPELRERLAREAAILSQLRHHNVVDVLDVGQVDETYGGGTYLAMEWLPNALDRVLRAHYPEPLTTVTSLRLAQGVAEGLDAVHHQGVVHRDVKASNVLLRTDGTPVLTDFGLATARATAMQLNKLTPENVILGTADYIAPEQVNGEPLDGRCDVYSLGVVLYEMLAGYVPFAGREPIDTLRAHLDEAPPPLPAQVPPAARAIVEQAMHKRREDRFASAGVMASAISAAVEELVPGSDTVAALPASVS